MWNRIYLFFKKINIFLNIYIYNNIYYRFRLLYYTFKNFIKKYYICTINILIYMFNRIKYIILILIEYIRLYIYYNIKYIIELFIFFLINKNTWIFICKIIKYLILLYLWPYFLLVHFTIIVCNKIFFFFFKKSLRETNFFKFFRDTNINWLRQLIILTVSFYIKNYNYAQYKTQFILYKVQLIVYKDKFYVKFFKILYKYTGNEYIVKLLYPFQEIFCFLHNLYYDKKVIYKYWYVKYLRLPLFIIKSKYIILHNTGCALYHYTNKFYKKYIKYQVVNNFILFFVNFYISIWAYFAKSFSKITDLFIKIINLFIYLIIKYLDYVYKKDIYSKIYLWHKRQMDSVDNIDNFIEIFAKKLSKNIIKKSSIRSNSFFKQNVNNCDYYFEIKIHINNMIKDIRSLLFYCKLFKEYKISLNLFKFIYVIYFFKDYDKFGKINFRTALNKSLFKQVNLYNKEYFCNLFNKKNSRTANKSKLFLEALFTKVFFFLFKKKNILMRTVLIISNQKVYNFYKKYRNLFCYFYCLSFCYIFKKFKYLREGVLFFFKLKLRIIYLFKIYVNIFKKKYNYFTIKHNLINKLCFYIKLFVYFYFLCSFGLLFICFFVLLLGFGTIFYMPELIINVIYICKLVVYFNIDCLYEISLSLVDLICMEDLFEYESIIYILVSYISLLLNNRNLEFLSSCVTYMYIYNLNYIYTCIMYWYFLCIDNIYENFIVNFNFLLSFIRYEFFNLTDENLIVYYVQNLIFFFEKKKLIIEFKLNECDWVLYSISTQSDIYNYIYNIIYINNTSNKSIDSKNFIETSYCLSENNEIYTLYFKLTLSLSKVLENVIKYEDLIFMLNILISVWYYIINNIIIIVLDITSYFIFNVIPNNIYFLLNEKLDLYIRIKFHIIQMYEYLILNCNYNDILYVIYIIHECILYISNKLMCIMLYLDKYILLYCVSLNIDVKLYYNIILYIVMLYELIVYLIHILMYMFIYINMCIKLILICIQYNYIVFAINNNNLYLILFFLNTEFLYLEKIILIFNLIKLILLYINTWIDNIILYVLCEAYIFIYAIPYLFISELYCVIINNFLKLISILFIPFIEYLIVITAYIYYYLAILKYIWSVEFIYWYKDFIFYIYFFLYNTVYVLPVIIWISLIVHIMYYIHLTIKLVLSYLIYLIIKLLYYISLFCISYIIHICSVFFFFIDFSNIWTLFVTFLNFNLTYTIYFELTQNILYIIIYTMLYIIDFLMFVLFDIDNASRFFLEKCTEIYLNMGYWINFGNVSNAIFNISIYNSMIYYFIMLHYLWLIRISWRRLEKILFPERFIIEIPDDNLSIDALWEKYKYDVVGKNKKALILTFDEYCFFYTVDLIKYLSAYPEHPLTKRIKKKNFAVNEYFFFDIDPIYEKNDELNFFQIKFRRVLGNIFLFILNLKIKLKLTIKKYFVKKKDLHWPQFIYINSNLLYIYIYVYIKYTICNDDIFIKFNKINIKNNFNFFKKKLNYQNIYNNIYNTTILLINNIVEYLDVKVSEWLNYCYDIYWIYIYNFEWKLNSWIHKYNRYTRMYINVSFYDKQKKKNFYKKEDFINYSVQLELSILNRKVKLDKRFGYKGRHDVLLRQLNNVKLDFISKNILSNLTANVYLNEAKLKYLNGYEEDVYWNKTLADSILLKFGQCKNYFYDIIQFPIMPDITGFMVLSTDKILFSFEKQFIKRNPYFNTYFQNVARYKTDISIFSGANCVFKYDERFGFFARNLRVMHITNILLRSENERLKFDFNENTFTAKQYEIFLKKFLKLTNSYDNYIAKLLDVNYNDYSWSRTDLTKNLIIPQIEKEIKIALPHTNYSKWFDDVLEEDEYIFELLVLRDGKRWNFNNFFKHKLLLFGQWFPSVDQLRYVVNEFLKKLNIVWIFNNLFIQTILFDIFNILSKIYIKFHEILNTFLIIDFDYNFNYHYDKSSAYFDELLNWLSADFFKFFNTSFDTLERIEFSSKFGNVTKFKQTKSLFNNYGFFHKNNINYNKSLLKNKTKLQQNNIYIYQYMWYKLYHIDINESILKDFHLCVLNYSIDVKIMKWKNFFYQTKFFDLKFFSEKKFIFLQLPSIEKFNISYNNRVKLKKIYLKFLLTFFNKNIFFHTKKYLSLYKRFFKWNQYVYINIIINNDINLNSIINNRIEFNIGWLLYDPINKFYSLNWLYNFLDLNLRNRKFSWCWFFFNTNLFEEKKLIKYNETFSLQINFFKRNKIYNYYILFIYNTDMFFKKTFNFMCNTVLNTNFFLKNIYISLYRYKYFLKNLCKYTLYVNTNNLFFLNEINFNLVYLLNKYTKLKLIPYNYPSYFKSRLIFFDPLLFNNKENFIKKYKNTVMLLLIPEVGIKLNEQISYSNLLNNSEYTFITYGLLCNFLKSVDFKWNHFEMISLENINVYLKYLSRALNNQTVRFLRIFLDRYIFEIEFFLNENSEKLYLFSDYFIYNKLFLNKILINKLNEIKWKLYYFLVEKNTGKKPLSVFFKDLIFDLNKYRIKLNTFDVNFSLGVNYTTYNTYMSYFKSIYDIQYFCHKTCKNYLLYNDLFNGNYYKELFYKEILTLPKININDNENFKIKKLFKLAHKSVLNKHKMVIRVLRSDINSTEMSYKPIYENDFYEFFNLNVYNTEYTFFNKKTYVAQTVFFLKTFKNQHFWLNRLIFEMDNWEKYFKFKTFKDCYYYYKPFITFYNSIYLCVKSNFNCLNYLNLDSDLIKHIEKFKYSFIEKNFIFSKEFEKSMSLLCDFIEDKTSLKFRNLILFKKLDYKFKLKLNLSYYNSILRKLRFFLNLNVNLFLIFENQNEKNFNFLKFVTLYGFWKKDFNVKYLFCKDIPNKILNISIYDIDERNFFFFHLNEAQINFFFKKIISHFNYYLLENVTTEVFDISKKKTNVNIFSLYMECNTTKITEIYNKLGIVNLFSKLQFLNLKQLDFPIFKYWNNKNDLTNIVDTKSILIDFNILTIFNNNCEDEINNTKKFDFIGKNNFSGKLCFLINSLSDKDDESLKKIIPLYKVISVQDMYSIIKLNITNKNICFFVPENFNYIFIFLQNNYLNSKFIVLMYKRLLFELNHEILFKLHEMNMNEKFISMYADYLYLANKINNIIFNKKLNLKQNHFDMNCQSLIFESKKKIFMLSNNWSDELCQTYIIFIKNINNKLLNFIKNNNIDIYDDELSKNKYNNIKSYIFNTLIEENILFAYKKISVFDTKYIEYSNTINVNNILPIENFMQNIVPYLCNKTDNGINIIMNVKTYCQRILNYDLLITNKTDMIRLNWFFLWKLNEKEKLYLELNFYDLVTLLNEFHFKPELYKFVKKIIFIWPDVILSFCNTLTTFSDWFNKRIGIENLSDNDVKEGKEYIYNMFVFFKQAVIEIKGLYKNKKNVFNELHNNEILKETLIVAHLKLYCNISNFMLDSNFFKEIEKKLIFPYSLEEDITLIRNCIKKNNVFDIKLTLPLLLLKQWFLSNFISYRYYLGLLIIKFPELRFFFDKKSELLLNTKNCIDLTEFKQFNFKVNFKRIKNLLEFYSGKLNYLLLSNNNVSGLSFLGKKEKNFKFLTSNYNVDWKENKKNFFFETKKISNNMLEINNFFFIDLTYIEYFKKILLLSNLNITSGYMGLKLNPFFLLKCNEELNPDIEKYTKNIFFGPLPLMDVDFYKMITCSNNINCLQYFLISEFFIPFLMHLLHYEPAVIAQNLYLKRFLSNLNQFRLFLLIQPKYFFYLNENNLVKEKNINPLITSDDVFINETLSDISIVVHESYVRNILFYKNMLNYLYRLVEGNNITTDVNIHPKLCILWDKLFNCNKKKNIIYEYSVLSLKNFAFRYGNLFKLMLQYKYYSNIFNEDDKYVEKFILKDQYISFNETILNEMIKCNNKDISKSFFFVDSLNLDTYSLYNNSSNTKKSLRWDLILKNNILYMEYKLLNWNKIKNGAFIYNNLSSFINNNVSEISNNFYLPITITSINNVFSSIDLNNSLFFSSNNEVIEYYVYNYMSMYIDGKICKILQKKVINIHDKINEVSYLLKFSNKIINFSIFHLNNIKISTLTNMTHSQLISIASLYNFYSVKCYTNMYTINKQLTDFIVNDEKFKVFCTTNKDMCLKLETYDLGLVTFRKSLIDLRRKIYHYCIQKNFPYEKLELYLLQQDAEDWLVSLHELEVFKNSNPTSIIDTTIRLNLEKDKEN